MKFAKGMLRVGTLKSDDGDIVITPERIAHWASQHRAMTEAGLGAPSSFDHSDDPTKLLPQKMAAGKGKRRSAADCVGWLDSLSAAEDGQSAELVLDLTDPMAIQRAERNEVEVSPVILEEFRDGTGKVWKDVISHVDLVHHPVDHRQTPFKPVRENAVACAIRMSLGGKLNVYRMAVDEEGDGDGENKDMPKQNAMAAQQQFDAIMAHFENIGLVMPSDTDCDNFMDRLLTALMTKAAADSKAKAEAKEKESKEDDDMSLDEKNPQYQAMSLELSTLRAEREQSHREKLGERIEGLHTSGRINTALRDELKGKVGVFKLSLDQSGKPEPTPLGDTLDTLEKLPAGASWDPQTRLTKMALEEVGAPTPESLSGELTDEEADAIADRVTRRKKAAAA